jgi:hypothetical protein
MRERQVGTWLSLVERTLGVGEVASSNLVVPTIYFSVPIMGSVLSSDIIGNTHAKPPTAKFLRFRSIIAMRVTSLRKNCKHDGV